MQVNLASGLPRESLGKTVAQAIGSVDVKGTMPILGNLLLEAEGDQLTISSTDLELSYRGTIPAEVTMPGSLTVPAIIFNKILQGLNQGPVALSTDETNRLTITQDESRYNLSGLPADQFPPIPNPDDFETRELIEVKTEDLKGMIDRTIFSASNDSYTYHLANILWESGDDNPLRFVSTDGHRLSLVDRPIEAQKVVTKKLLAPAKGMRELLRFIQDKTAVRVAVNEKILAIMGYTTALFIRLHDANFPDYARLIPGEPQLRFTLNREQLTTALRRLSLITTERFKGITFTFDGRTAELFSQNVEVGQGKEKIDAVQMLGDPAGLPFMVGVNAPYLMEPLKNMVGEHVVLEFTEPGRPIILRDEGDPDYLCLVMPMSLD